MIDELTNTFDTLENISKDIAVTSNQFVLEPNSLYLVKIRAVDEDLTTEEQGIEIQLGFNSINKLWTPLRSVELVLPVVSDADDAYGQPGKWYEQMLFIKTDDISNSLRCISNTPEKSTLNVRVTNVFIDFPNFLNLIRIIDEMALMTATLNGRIYQPFMGLNDAKEYLETQRLLIEASQLPILQTVMSPPKADFLRIGLIGDEILAGMLETSAICERIGQSSLPLIEGGAFDLIILQNRAVEIAPIGISKSEEQQYLSDLVIALSQTQTPTIEIAASGANELEVMLRPLKQCEQTSIEVIGAEYEFSKFAPIRGSSWNASTIAMPCASDLYQYPELQNTAIRLLKSGFNLALSESNFDHAPIRTWERFNDPKVKVYGRLSGVEQAELFRNCNFVLLPSVTLRPLADIVNLAVMALMSGALPILIDKCLPPPLNEIVESVWGYADLHNYLAGKSSLIVREHHWLSRFRKYMAFARHGRLRNTLQTFALGKMSAGAVAATASAELICVSKRPKNLPLILENYSRQAYNNIGLHLIWNVPHYEAQACLSESRKYFVPNLRVTILDETNNIGSCLNYGIRESQADYWFKIDDDDYYGVNYVEDLINNYELTGYAAQGKPSSFILFNESEKLYLRDHSLNQIRRPLQSGKYICGATLSARADADLPIFSTSHRNSCDSHWVENLQASGASIGVSDFFNFCIQRGKLEEHTWQVMEDKIQETSTQILGFGCMEWLDAN